MIPSEEAAQMIGGGGGGGSNGTHLTYITANNWLDGYPFWFGEHDERGRNTGYRSLERELKMDMSLDSNKGNFPNAGFGFTQGFNHFYGGEKVNTDGSFSLVGGYKNGNFKAEHSENLKN